VLRRDSALKSTSARQDTILSARTFDIIAGAKAALLSRTETSSKVFQRPQEGHFPYQRGDSNPQSEHMKLVFTFTGGMVLLPL
jgi:hypothetical protein